MSECPDAASVFKALGDKSRLSIIRILLEGESYVERIASRLSLSNATVCHHLKKLEGAGLVQNHRTQFYQIYSVRRDLLDTSLSTDVYVLYGPYMVKQANTVKEKLIKLGQEV